MLEITIIGNKYADDISTAVGANADVLRGECSFTELQSVIIDVSKNKYLDVLIFDSTCIPEADFLNAVRDLKLHLPKSVRIVVLKPNLDDKATIQQLYVYGVYDIVNPKIDYETMEELEVDNIIINQVKWALSEPVEFSNIVDDLSVELITQNIVNEIPVQPVPVVEKKVKKSNKPRLLLVYNDEPKNFDAFTKDKKYNIVGIVPDADVVDQDLSAVDFIVLDNVDIENVVYIKSLVEVNSNPALVVAGFQDYETFSNAAGLKGVHCFLYDDNFKRSALKAFAEETKVETEAAKLFAVLGVKGGVGATTLTAIMAKNYVKKHPSARVCVVDYNTKAGDLGIKFGIAQPNKNLYQFIERVCKARREHLDLALLKDKINNYVDYIKKDRLFVLPTSYTDIFHFCDYSVQEIAYAYEYVFECLRDNFDAIFIDVSKYAGFTYEIAMNKSHKIYLVSDAKLPSVYHLLTKYEELQKDNVSIIINRANPKYNEGEYENLKLIEKKVPEMIKLPVDKKLLEEENEMDIEYTSKFKSALSKLVL